MADNVTGAVLHRRQTSEPDLDMDFTLDVRVIEASLPVAELMRSTSDNCGSTCAGTACTTRADDPA
jgi:FxLD family lantipeptide